MENPWYQAGLSFSCTRCGNCCTGSPGTVFVSPPEIEELATAVELDADAFIQVYTRTLADGATSLRERSDGSCALYDPQKGCTVYGARPKQCQTFPFWRNVVASAAAWDREARQCPGMNRGSIRPAHEIDQTSANDGTLSSARAKGTRFNSPSDGRPPR